MNLSLANFKKIKLSTTCLYSEGSTEPLNLLAESHRISSVDLVCIFLAILKNSVCCKYNKLPTSKQMMVLNKLKNSQRQNTSFKIKSPPTNTPKQKSPMTYHH